MENNNFENRIKQSFQGYHPELDNDQIWDEIEPHLKKKKKRRFIIWFLFAGLALGFWGLKTVNPTLFGTNQKTLVESQDIPSPINETVSTDLQNENEKSVLNEVEPSFNKNSISEKKANSFNTTPTPRLPIYSSQKNLTEDVNKSINAEPGIASLPKNHERVEPKKEAILEGTYKEASDKTLKGKEGDPFTIEEDSKLYENIDKPIPQTQKKDITTAKKSKKEKTKKRRNKSKKKKRKRKKRKRRKNIFKLPGQYYAQILVGPSLPIKALKFEPANQGLGNSAYASERKATEKQLEAFGAEFNIQYKNKRGLIVATGLGYQQFNERFGQKTITEKIEVKTGTLTVTENSEGDIISSTTGPKTIKTTEIDELKIYNHYRFINASIAIGGALENRRNHIKFLGGLQYNLFYEFSGTLLNPNLKPVSLKKTFDDRYDGYFNKKAGMGLLLTAEYSRKINKRLNWIIAPKIVIPFSPLTPNDYKLSQRYYTFSVNLGFNYLLNPKKKKRN